ncbi:helix-turn-helix domain-containing protein [Pseudomonas luteola]|uniref:helix-turn-helix domain-containing protein n=1 Tax=Pseudomonas luteola TaxID=47886 RepID=UPI0015E3BBFD|nr:LexA family transcriptional regulator [Pseudomonas zeshuii]MBA1250941.1 helix-turn-helix domain-containing protein [Pseudomonas zeshuii]
MPEKITIGPAVRRHRRELGWSLQKLCDRAHNAVGNGYLSDIETGVSNPTIDKAHAIAKALGTTIDQLIAESKSGNVPMNPSETVRSVPVVPWDMAADWAENPDISRLPSGTPFVLPVSPDAVRGFYLRLHDDSMHAPAGPAFPAGSLIFVDPQQQAVPNDYVVGYTARRTEPEFKKLVQSGSQRYLRALNPQLPATEIQNDFTVIGVVTSMVMMVARGMVR